MYELSLVWAKTLLEMSVLGYVLCFVALLDYHVHTVAMIVMYVQVNISTSIHVYLRIYTYRQ